MKRVAVILATRDEANLEYEKGRSFLRWLSSTFSKAGCGTLGVVRANDSEVRDRHPDALLIHAVERPAIRSSTIDKLLKALDGGAGVVPDFDGAAGHPVVLTRAT